MRRENLASLFGRIKAVGDDVAVTMTRSPLFVALCLVFACSATLAAGCGSGGNATDVAVTIEPLASSTPRTLPPIGGKPETPPVQATAAPPTAEPTSPALDPTAAPPTAEPVAPTATPTPITLDGSTAPIGGGRWIDVDVSTYVVRLMDGSTMMQEISPVAVGIQIDTGEYASTQTGLFYVHTKIEELAYDPPYDTYISHWIGFDADRANGFHSFLKDAEGNVVDPATGRVSNGCIRTGAPEAIFAYAEIGMPVWVHW